MTNDESTAPQGPANSPEPAAQPVQPAPAAAPAPRPQYVPPMANWSPPPAAPAKQPGGFKRGFGTGFGFGTAMIIFSVVMSVMSGVILIAMAAAFGSAASSSTAIGRTMTVWGDELAPASSTIRAIHVSGPIQTSGGDGLGLTAMTYGYEVASILDSLKAEDAAGVIVLVNTPGGTVTGSKAIADGLARYKKRTGKKAIAFVEGLAASGGMYAMTGVDEIIADHGTLIGSIGVLFGPFERYKDVVGTSGTLFTPGISTTGGITQEYLTQGKGKDFGNPFRDMTAEERAKLMVGLEKSYDAFVSAVSTARGISAETIKNDIGAYIYDEQTAMGLKLIDKVMSRDEAFRHTAEAMGLDPAKARISAPRPPTMMESLLGAEQRVFGQSATVNPGDKVQVTSVLCTGTPQPMVYYGPLTAVCGR